MNKGMLTVGIILLSLIALLLINVLNNYMTGGELDYYLVKETADAAMIDSIDNFYQRTCGLPRMDKEKFIESFIYRLGNSVDSNREYDIRFFDLNEVPPKVSIQVDSLTVLSVKSADKNGNVNSQAVDISTRYSAIAETNYKYDPTTEEGLQATKGPKNNYCTSIK